MVGSSLIHSVFAVSEIDWLYVFVSLFFPLQTKSNIYNWSNDTSEYPKDHHRFIVFLLFAQDIFNYNQRLCTFPAQLSHGMHFYYLLEIHSVSTTNHINISIITVSLKKKRRKWHMYSLALNKNFHHFPSYFCFEAIQNNSILSNQKLYDIYMTTIYTTLINNLFFQTIFSKIKDTRLISFLSKDYVNKIDIIRWFALPNPMLLKPWNPT